MLLGNSCALGLTSATGLGGEDAGGDNSPCRVTTRVGISDLAAATHCAPRCGQGAAGSSLTALSKCGSTFIAPFQH